MKKQELIHLHGLLSQVHDQCAAWEGEELDLEDYRKHSIRPTSIHKSKSDHKAAVFDLAHGITEAAEESEQERVAAQAD